MEKLGLPFEDYYHQGFDDGVKAGLKEQIQIKKEETFISALFGGLFVGVVLGFVATALSLG